MAGTHNPAEFNRKFLAVFAILLVVMAFAYIFGITFLKLPDTADKYVGTILGAILGVVIATPIGFFYGNSKRAEPPPAATFPQVTDASVK